MLQKATSKFSQSFFLSTAVLHNHHTATTWPLLCTSASDGSHCCFSAFFVLSVNELLSPFSSQTVWLQPLQLCCGMSLMRGCKSARMHYTYGTHTVQFCTCSRLENKGSLVGERAITKDPWLLKKDTVWTILQRSSTLSRGLDPNEKFRC